jgi:hypothetical protein
MHLAYRWFCRLDLDDRVPDHSTFSVNRHGRFRSSNIFRQLFEAVVRACMDAGLLQGEGFAVDASVIEANASRYHGKAPDEIDWSAPERQTRAVVEFLDAIDDEICRDICVLPPKSVETQPRSRWNAIILSVRNNLQQLGRAIAALGRDNAELGHVPTDRIRQHRALTDQKLPAAMTLRLSFMNVFDLLPQRLPQDEKRAIPALLILLTD